VTRIRNTLVAISTLLGVAAAQEEVTVYVSLDQEHSERLVQQFEKETGIKVNARYDTEANKTVGLMRQLIEEKNDPVADVWWNNEIATTIKLKQHGVLQPYQSPSAVDIPAEFKDPEGYWTGFAARARVLIVNTDLVKGDRPRSMWDLCDPKWRGQIAMARPETGTTAAHAAALFVLDEAKANEYFDKLLQNDCVWLTSNGHVKNDVASGRYAFGWTDTDDFNVARLQGKPVAMVYPDAGEGEQGVLYIPNTIVMIKGAPHPGPARRFIDWVLRPEIEAELAKSATAQIPVRRGVPVPDHVKRPDQIGTIMPANWERIGREWERWVEHTRLKLQSAGAEEAQSTLTWLLVGVGAAVLLGVIILKRATGEPK